MILLDTHVVAWLALEPASLSAAAHNAISAARREDGVAISDQTLWELAMMVAKKKIEVDRPLLEFLRSAESYAHVFPINAAIAECSISFGQSFPKDPADRIIAATAIIHGLPLVTSDEAIRKSREVPCIW